MSIVACAVKSLFRIIKAVHMDGEIIRLNVGGTMFSTTRATLTDKGDNYFTSLLSGRFKTSRDEQGVFFIDR